MGRAHTRLGGHTLTTSSMNGLPGMSLPPTVILSLWGTRAVGMYWTVRSLAGWGDGALHALGAVGGCQLAGEQVGGERN